MLLLVVVILSVVTVRPAGGSLSALGRVHLRYVPAIFGALALQIAIVSVVPGGSPWLHRVLHVGSYALAAVFVVANRRIAGMRILGLGATLNLIAILANNGVMPASRSALRTAGRLTSSTDFMNSAVVPHPHLLFLGDILAVPHGVPLANVYSIGDVCIAVGVAIAIHGLAGSRLVPRRGAGTLRGRAGVAGDRGSGTRVRRASAAAARRRSPQDDRDAARRRLAPHFGHRVRVR